MENADTLDDATTTGLFVTSIVENNVHACIGTILTGFHVLTLCTCTTIWSPDLEVYIAKAPEVLKAVGGAEDLRHHTGVERDIRFNFPHPYCGGNLSHVDLAVLQLWIPWPLTKNFAVGQLHLDFNMTYFEYLFETKHLENPICKTSSWWRYEVVQAPQSSSPKLDATEELQSVNSKVVRSSVCLPFDIDVLGDKHTIKTIPKLFEKDKMCVMHQLDKFYSCGVDKGAPLICYMEQLGWRLYAIGLGGTSCNGKQSLSLFQGFSNSLAYIRLYLGIDLTLRNYKHVDLKTYNMHRDKT